MKSLFWKIFLVFFILTIANAYAIEFRPASAKAMDVTIQLRGSGTVTGLIEQNDHMDVLALTFKDSETIRVVSVEEKLRIGNDVLTPVRYQNEGENKYAVFTINNLGKYGGNPKFDVEIDARLVSSAIFALGQDSKIRGVDGELRKFLDETKYIESNDQELRSKAALEFTSDSSLETIRQVSQWVNNNIEYDFANYYNGIWSAKQTYNSRAGVCDEFANLTAAFLRIKGLPARYVSGISFDGERFGNHGWIEVYIEGTGWTGVDSTYGEAGYVDAAHFPLSKSRDAGESFNIRTTTYSISTLNAELRLEDPEVVMNDVSFFTDLVELDVDVPEKVGTGEEFEIRARVKNLQNSNIIIPVELLMHDDFSVDSGAKLELFKPFEEKEVVWKATAPTSGREGFFATYEMHVYTPDKNFSSKIDVYPGGIPAENSNVKVKDVSPFIDNGRMQLQITLENSGSEIGSAAIEILFEGGIVTEREVSIGPGEKKVVQMEIVGVETGELFLAVKTDNPVQMKITIPEKIEKPVELPTEEVTQEEFDNAAGNQPIESLLGNGEQMLLLGVGVVVLLAAVAAILASAVLIKGNL